tara:strand:- start:832 stop:1497 length:666 start_codon:yes stop_codon:yes gene_type:complete
MNLLKLTARILLFRFTLEDIQSFRWPHLVFGLFGTWIAGMGRYWDSPNASLFQHLGLGSVIYVFVLSALLMFFIWAAGSSHLTYFRMLTFVSLTSFPAILYAIPIEQFSTIETATTVNARFLAIVALWRVGLLVRFTQLIGPMRWLTAVITSLVPLMAIVAGLTSLNLHKVVFDVMAGFREANPENSSYMILMTITYLSIFAIIPVLIAFACIVYTRRKYR